ncbi:hypothetical protein BVX95_02320 [archaeon D22]|nr:hypothetical protein BVX95_02320 [archaeon D22]
MKENEKVLPLENQVKKEMIIPIISGAISGAVATATDNPYMAAATFVGLNAAEVASRKYVNRAKDIIEWGFGTVAAASTSCMTYSLLDYFS